MEEATPLKYGVTAPALSKLEEFELFYAYGFFGAILESLPFRTPDPYLLFFVGAYLRPRAKQQIPSYFEWFSCTQAEINRILKQISHNDKVWIGDLFEWAVRAELAQDDGLALPSDEEMASQRDKAILQITPKFIAVAHADMVYECRKEARKRIYENETKKHTAFFDESLQRMKKAKQETEAPKNPEKKPEEKTEEKTEEKKPEEKKPEEPVA
jgi:hypothetical protein